jgi:hypothetical protein
VQRLHEPTVDRPRLLIDGNHVVSQRIAHIELDMPLRHGKDGSGIRNEIRDEDLTEPQRIRRQDPRGSPAPSPNKLKRGIDQRAPQHGISARARKNGDGSGGAPRHGEWMIRIFMTGGHRTCLTRAQQADGREATPCDAPHISLDA